MNIDELKRYALLVECSIGDAKGEDKDVEFLSDYAPLCRAISEAKAGLISEPRDLGGLSRWLLESNIRNHPVLSDRLSAFMLLLRGWDLPRSPAAK